MGYGEGGDHLICFFGRIRQFSFSKRIFAWWWGGGAGVPCSDPDVVGLSLVTYTGATRTEGTGETTGTASTADHWGNFLCTFLC